VGTEEKEVTMSFTWRDGLATVLVGVAVVLYLLSQGGTTVAGLTGTRALAVAIVGLGVGGCYTAKSQMPDVYGVGDGPRPTRFYVVLASVLGGVMLIAGLVAVSGGSPGALGMLTGAMVAIWAMSTIRHSTSRWTHEVIHPAR
jgi:hypothetical protein